MFTHIVLESTETQLRTYLKNRTSCGLNPPIQKMQLLIHVSRDGASFDVIKPDPHLSCWCMLVILWTCSPSKVQMVSTMAPIRQGHCRPERQLANLVNIWLCQ